MSALMPGPIPPLDVMENWRNMSRPVTWKEWAEANKIYDAMAYLLLEEPRKPEDYYRDGHPFRPEPEVYEIPEESNQRDIMISIIDRILATSYMPNNPWHRLAFRWLMFFRWQKHGGIRLRTRRSKATYYFDRLQNEDGSPRILANTNFEVAEASRDELYPIMDEDQRCRWYDDFE